MVTFVAERLNSLELDCREFERGQQHKQSQSVNGMSAAPSFVYFPVSIRQDVLAGRTGCCQSATVVAQRTFVVTPSGAGGNTEVGFANDPIRKGIADKLQKFMYVSLRIYAL